MIEFKVSTNAEFVFLKEHLQSCSTMVAMIVDDQLISRVLFARPQEDMLPFLEKVKTIPQGIADIAQMYCDKFVPAYPIYCLHVQTGTFCEVEDVFLFHETVLLGTADELIEECGADFRIPYPKARDA